MTAITAIGGCERGACDELVWGAAEQRDFSGATQRIGAAGNAAIRNVRDGIGATRPYRRISDAPTTIYTFHASIPTGSRAIATKSYWWLLGTAAIHAISATIYTVHVSIST